MRFLGICSALCFVVGLIAFLGAAPPRITIPAMILVLVAVFFALARLLLNPR